jgi:hypothetical protein
MFSAREMASLMVETPAEYVGEDTELMPVVSPPVVSPTIVSPPVVSPPVVSPTVVRPPVVSDETPLGLITSMKDNPVDVAAVNASPLLAQLEAPRILPRIEPPRIESPRIESPRIDPPRRLSRPSFDDLISGSDL